MGLKLYIQICISELNCVLPFATAYVTFIILTSTGNTGTTEVVSHLLLQLTHKSIVHPNFASSKMKSHSNENEMVHEEPVVDIPLEDPVVEDDDVETQKVEQSDDAESPSKRPNHVAAWIWARDFFLAYDFPILILIFIGVAKAAPEVGATYVAPDITAYWIAVALIFCKSKSQFNESSYFSINLI